MATVTWIGYEAPQMSEFTDDTDLTDTVASADTAQAGGRALAGFLNGIDASRDSDPHLTALGQSYGSTTTGYALQEGTGVDDAVFYGTPGVGTSDVAALGLPSGHVFVAEADGDPVADLGAYGSDPNRLPGVTGLDTHAGVSPDGVERTGSTGHSQYTVNGTMAQYNQAVVIAGVHDATVQDDGRDDGDRSNPIDLGDLPE